MSLAGLAKLSIPHEIARQSLNVTLGQNSVLKRGKLKRELARLGKQFQNLPSTLRDLQPMFFDRFLSTLYYDYFLAHKVESIEGGLPRREKVAIFLIYPNLGLTIGHIESLKCILSAGYSPLIVSNCVLSEDDIQRLRPLAYRILVRPNYGYDFGGYRDGIRLLKGDHASLSNLVILNDSCWFPLPNSKNWLEIAEGMGVDFAGALSHSGPKWINAINNPQTTHSQRRRYQEHFHFCSFALMFSRGALRREEFWSFWDHLRLSSSKDRTVKYGEQALSTFMFKNGFSHMVAVSQEDLAESIKNLRPPQQTEELQIFHAEGGYPAYALTEHLWTQFDYMFLKKKLNGTPVDFKSAPLKEFAKAAGRLLCDVNEPTNVPEDVH